MKESFIGRKKELAFLEDLYNSDKFEMLIMHGRRRVGKSCLLSHFAKKHEGHAVFFSADKSSEQANVANFCSALDDVLNIGEYLKALSTWNEVYSFFSSYEVRERLVIIIDEFTYLYHSNPSFDSGLQNAIDNVLRKKNIMVVLCGSEVSVIQETFGNSSKPLYGRKTAELQLLPFTYDEARDFFPNYDKEQALVAYCILGGIPLYLSLFDDRVDIRENVIRNSLSSTGYLFQEVDTLLRMELKEPAFYKDILSTISSGSSSFNDIRSKIGEDGAKVSKYLSVLIGLGIVRKETPCGEKEKTRNTLYSICDNYVAFHFQFIHKHQGMLNGLISPELYYDRMIRDSLGVFLGHRFEGVCETHLKRLFREGKMPFFAEELGRWWGGNPVLKRPEEIDIVAMDDENAMFCECKYTGSPFDEKQMQDLLDSSLCIDRPKKWYVVFSKSGVTTSVLEKMAKDSSWMLVDAF